MHATPSGSSGWGRFHGPPHADRTRIDGSRKQTIPPMGSIGFVHLLLDSVAGDAPEASPARHTDIIQTGMQSS